MRPRNSAGTITVPPAPALPDAYRAPGRKPASVRPGFGDGLFGFGGVDMSVGSLVEVHSARDTSAGSSSWFAAGTPVVPPVPGCRRRSSRRLYASSSEARPRTYATFE